MQRGPSSGWLVVGALILQTSVLTAWKPQRAPGLLPQVTVPDTRGLRFAADTAVVTAALAILGQAMPNEGGVCFYGDLAAVNGQMTVLARRVVPARGHGRLGAFDWAPRMGHGCPDAPDLVGAGHSHPYSTCDSEESALPDSRADADARALAGDPRLLFSLIWCFGQARAVILWQHGGREVVEYLDLGTSSNHTAACAGRGGPGGDLPLLRH